MKKNVRIIFLILVGLGIALVGFYFSAGFVALIGSSDPETDLIVGLLYFLCILVTVCTGLVLSKLNALKKQLDQREPERDASGQGQEPAREG